MYNARQIVGALIGFLALLGLAAAAWVSVLLGRADAEFRKGTPVGVARAAELAPRNTAYLSMHALQLEYAGADPEPLLEEIARLNPDSSAPRIRLGLDAEVRGNLVGAERWLLDAARVDRQYEPRWTLANFYFRRQRMNDFWTWLRSALEISYGDRAAIFDLAWAASSDSQVILARAIPERHEVISAYLAYLGDRFGEAEPVALRLSQWHNPADAPALLHWMDGALMLGSRAAAREVWINLGYPAPAMPVFNPDFGPPRIGHGFDWWLAQNPGVSHISLDTPPGHRIVFNGMQPESCELLRQYVGVSSGKRYRLQWESRGIGSGIAWRAGIESAPLLASADWSQGRLSFIASPGPGVITLLYNRPLGEPRAEGSVELRHVSIEEQP
jgi:hypothetical protein